MRKYREFGGQFLYYLLIYLRTVKGICCKGKTL